MPHSTISTSSKPGVSSALKTAGFLRRLTAMLYDSLLLIAILFAATAAALPFNHGEAFTSNNYYYLAYLILVSFLFFGWFWTHGGQTLGLRSWKLKVLTVDQRPLTWRQAFIRFITAILSWTAIGLGFLWIFVDKNNRGWHDLLSNTAVFFDDRHQDGR
ncbi:MAG: RDD family protein [Gammaproteobacteria bacterium]